MGVIRQKYINDMAYEIVGCAIEVHKELGPGLLESVYQRCFKSELENTGFDVRSGVGVPITYKGRKLNGMLRIDLLVEDLIIVEIKSVEQIIPLYQAQLLSYLKLTKKPKGLLINFNTDNIVKQMIPLVTEEFSKLPKE